MSSCYKDLPRYIGQRVDNIGSRFPHLSSTPPNWSICGTKCNLLSELHYLYANFRLEKEYCSSRALSRRCQINWKSSCFLARVRRYIPLEMRNRRPADCSFFNYSSIIAFYSVGMNRGQLAAVDVKRSVIAIPRPNRYSGDCGDCTILCLVP